MGLLGCLCSLLIPEAGSVASRTACVLVLLILGVGSVLSQCYEVEMSKGYHEKVNGVYFNYDIGLECSGKPIYEHVDKELFMFHLLGYWIVHDYYCFPETVEIGHLRVLDPADYPESITNIWEENYSLSWEENPEVDVVCYSGSGTLSTPVIVAISVSCAVLVAGAITLTILLLRKRKRDQKIEKKNVPIVLPPTFLSENSRNRTDTINSDKSRPRGGSFIHDASRPRSKTLADEMPRTRTNSFGADTKRTRSGTLTNDVTKSTAKRTRSSTLTELSRPRSSTLTELQRSHKPSLRELSRPRTKTLTELSRPRSGTLTELSRPRSGTLTDNSRQRSGTLIELSRPRSGTLTEHSRPRSSTLTNTRPRSGSKTSNIYQEIYFTPASGATARHAPRPRRGTFTEETPRPRSTSLVTDSRPRTYSMDETRSRSGSNSFKPNDYLMMAYGGGTADAGHVHGHVNLVYDVVEEENEDDETY